MQDIWHRHNRIRHLPHKASAVRVLLVDDHAMVREGLRSVLESYDDVEIVGEAANGEEAVAMAEQLRPRLVVMDINMPKHERHRGDGSYYENLS